MKIIHDRFPKWNEYQVTTFALMVELMVALNIYGGGTITVADDSGDTPLEPPGWMDDDEEEEPWKRGQA